MGRVLQIGTVCLLYFASTAGAKPPPLLECKPEQVRAITGRSGVGGGSLSTEIVFQNISSSSCRLGALPHFEQFDSTGVQMPIKVGRNASLDTDGAGSTVVELKTLQSTAVTLQSTNRTGYDESRHCATKIRVSLSSGQKDRPVLSFDTISCQDNMGISGFHPEPQ